MSDIEETLDDWAYYNERLDEIREFGLNPAYYKDKTEELLGELMLREMGDVSGPGSLDPEHGAYRGCDAPIERYPYNPSS